VCARSAPKCPTRAAQHVGSPPRQETASVVIVARGWI